MKNRIILAIKILLGYDIIVYEKKTKAVKSVINGNLDLMQWDVDYALDKGYVFGDNDGKFTYLGDHK